MNATDNTVITVKNALLGQWLAKAEEAEKERNHIISRFHPEDWHAANGRKQIYSEAARILASGDGIDHVKAALRERLTGAKADSSIRVWAALITDLETAAA